MPRHTLFTEAANLAIHSLAFLASLKPTERASSGRIAGVLNVSEAHLGKVLQRLARAGVLESARGPKGGFTLSREPQQMSLLEIVELIDGPLQTEGCLLGKPVCAGGICKLQSAHIEVYGLLRDHLAKTYLSDVARTIDSPVPLRHDASE